MNVVQCLSLEQENRKQSVQETIRKILLLAEAQDKASQLDLEFRHHWANQGPTCCESRLVRCTVVVGKKY